jgi:large subunit ribosomal protein L10
MDKDTKHAQSAALREQIEGLTAFVIVEYERLTVAESERLRIKFREAGCTYRVYKNSVIRYAVTGTHHEPITPHLKGVSGLAYHADDPGAPARVARDFAKETDKLRLKAAVVDGEVLAGEHAAKLADMPGPREIKAKLLMLFKTPATRMVQVMQAAPRDFLRVLNAKKKKDEEAAA